MAFYNDYRPGRWKELLGQPQIVEILKSQAKNGHFAPSYLFFGASGTGKTTTARILASCLNCYSLNGDGEPCGQCQSCKAIKDARHWDIIEVDGARFRGIEDAKDLAYRAYLSPLERYKVYIIDECHQLTDGAWNSLLKLLAEPPPHLVVILCTTDFAKIPEPVSSRCQLYPFTKLKPEDIKQKLELICEREGISPHPKHIQFITQSSQGNLRSAENLLEQVSQIKQ